MSLLHIWCAGNTRRGVSPNVCLRRRIADCYRAYEGQEVDGLVRLLSCGHDGQLALWDFDTSPEALAPIRCEHSKFSAKPCQLPCLY